MTAKKTTVAKAVVPKRPVVKQYYGGMSAYSIENKSYNATKMPTPTKKLKEWKSKALGSKKVSEFDAQVKAFADEYGVSVDDIKLYSSQYRYSAVIYLQALVEESDEKFNKRVAAVAKHNKAIDAYRADKKAQDAWDKKYYVPPAPKVSPTRSYPQDIQVLLQTVLSDPEIDAIIRRKYSY